MSDVTPVIPGYQFDQRLLEHPLAELWHGRTFTGMEIVALVLSEAGARDETVRERLMRAGREAAFESDQLETPLWAANFSTDRPYAITQLIPGQSGAERLIDPLDGVIGNDDESVQAVRSQLSQYGAMAPSLPLSDAEAGAIPTYADHPQGQPGAQGQPGTQSQPSPQGQPSQTGQAAGQSAEPQGHGERSALGVAREYRRKIGGWAYLVAAVIVLIVFTVTYSVGAAIGSAVKKDPNEAAAAPAAAVSPGAYPSPVLLPAIKKITTAPYKRPDGSPGVFGATYAAGTDLQVITNAELPFAFGWPRPPEVTPQGESSQVVYRKVQTNNDMVDGASPSELSARIALHPCASLAACLADRAAFDKQWTTAFKVPAPAAAKASRTWLTTQAKNPYVETMTRAYQSGGQWWLVGAAVTGAPGEEPDAQRIVNDIWRQLS